MFFRKKRTALLASVAILLAFAILDVSIRKEEVFESFGSQFENEAMNNTHDQATREVKVTMERSIEIQSIGIHEVHLPTYYGKVAVNRSKDSTIRLLYTVTAQAANEAEANKRQSAIEVQKETTNGKVSLVSKANGKPVDYSRVSIDYVLFLPDGIKVNLINESGTVRINGLKSDVDVTTVRGMAEIVDVSGTVAVNSDFSNVYLTDILGDIKLLNHFGEANMNRITGSVVVDSRRGRTYMNHIEGSVKAETEQGYLLVQEIVGSVEVRNGASDVQLGQIQGDTKINVDSGETTVVLTEAEGYSLNVVSEGGRIWTQLPIAVEREGGKSTLQGDIGEGRWKVEIEAKNGNVNLQYK